MFKFFDSKHSPLDKGTQIALIPDHANGDINHQDVKFGFVSSHDPRTNNVYCRFWSDITPDDLRNKANSEFCEFRNIYLHTSRPQELVHKMIEQYDI